MVDKTIKPVEEIRKEKLKKITVLKERGVDPYPPSSKFNLKPINEILILKENDNAEVVGRVVSKRGHGKLVFMDLRDGSGKAQVAFKADIVNDMELVEQIDEGDFIEVKGKIFTTKSGEFTVLVEKFHILSKAIRAIPDKWQGLKDKELRYRKRYLDLLVNEESKKIFDTRHKIIRGVRDFLNTKKLVEVETPILQPLYGGANAKPFTTRINALDAKAYLRIAPELYLKRLIVGGYEGIYEIARNFRNEGVDQTHFPEFTMLEAYVAYCDYHKMMDLMEDLLKYINNECLEQNTVMVGEKEVNLNQAWKRVEMTTLITEHLDLDVMGEGQQGLEKYLADKKIDFEKGATKGELIFLIFDELVASQLVDPTWVIDYPIEVSPLAKSHRDKEGFTERFELYVGGKEIMDGWSEVIDPLEQRARFEAENYRKLDETEEAQPLDEDFLEAMEYGMPPLGGVGVGMDRLTMFFTNTWFIQETILFPFKKPVEGSNIGNEDEPKSKA